MTIYYARSYYNVREYNKEVQVGDAFKDSSKSGRWLVITEVLEGGLVPYVKATTLYNRAGQIQQSFFYEVRRGPRGLFWIKGNFKVRPAPPIPVVRKAYYVGKGMPRYREKEYAYG